MKALWLVALMVGCAGPAVRPVVGPDGSQHFAVRCGDMTRCYERAAATCRGPYDIVDHGASVHSTPVYHNAFTGQVTGGQASTTNTLLVRCRG